MCCNTRRGKPYTSQHLGQDHEDAKARVANHRVTGPTGNHFSCEVSFQKLPLELEALESIGQTGAGAIAKDTYFGSVKSQFWEIESFVSWTPNSVPFDILLGVANYNELSNREIIFVKFFPKILPGGPFSLKEYKAAFLISADLSSLFQTSNRYTFGPLSS